MPNLFTPPSKGADGYQQSFLSLQKCERKERRTEQLAGFQTRAKDGHWLSRGLSVGLLMARDNFSFEKRRKEMEKKAKKEEKKKRKLEAGTAPADESAEEPAEKSLEAEKPAE